MSECVASFIVTTYNPQTRKIESTPIPITINNQNWMVDEDESITVDIAAKKLAAMSLEERGDLVAKLKTARSQKITSDLLKQKFSLGGEEGKRRIRLIGNTSIGELAKLYGLQDELNDIQAIVGTDPLDGYTIISDVNVSINGKSYVGRAVTGEGQEVFFINRPYTAKNFLKYVQARERAKLLFPSEVNFTNEQVEAEFNKNSHYSTMFESLRPELEDLRIICQHYHTSPQELMVKHLNNQNLLQAFRVQDRLIVPRQVLGKIASILANEYDNNLAYTDLELALLSAKEETANSDQKWVWRFPKSDFYSLIKFYWPEIETAVPLNTFLRMNSEEMNEAFKTLGVFRGHPQLSKAVIAMTSAAENTEQVEAVTEIKLSPLSFGKEATDQATRGYKSTWDELVRTNPQAGLPKTFNELKEAIRTGKDGWSVEAFNQKGIKYFHGTQQFPVVMKEGKEGKKGNKRLNTYVEIPFVKTPKDKSKIILHFPFTTIGEHYNFVGYQDEQTIFTPITDEEVKQVDSAKTFDPLTGLYENQFYIYKKTVPITDVNGKQRQVYVLSRHIISGSPRVDEYPTLEAALKQADRKLAQETIQDNSLISIKQHQGLPRKTKLELKEVYEGQIISTLDLALDNIDASTFPPLLRGLFKMTVEDFQKAFSSLEAEGIYKLNTPEKAAAFIYKLRGALITRGFSITSTTTVNDLIAAVRPQLQGIIQQIEEAPRVHFVVESVQSTSSHSARAKVKEGILKRLGNDLVGVNITGNRVGQTLVSAYIGQSLTTAIDNLQNMYGVNIHTYSTSELESYLGEQGLTQYQASSIKAFIHNGEIHINTSLAKDSDLYHEIAHLFCGILKVVNPDKYKELLKNFTTKRAFTNKFNHIQKIYSSLAYQDQIEETIADIIGDSLMATADIHGEFTAATFEGNPLLQSIITEINAAQASLADRLEGQSVIRHFLTSGDTRKTLADSRKITNFIEKAIYDQTIKEICN